MWRLKAHLGQAFHLNSALFLFGDNSLKRFFIRQFSDWQFFLFGNLPFGNFPFGNFPFGYFALGDFPFGDFAFGDVLIGDFLLRSSQTPLISCLDFT